MSNISDTSSNAECQSQIMKDRLIKNLIGEKVNSQVSIEDKEFKELTSDFNNFMIQMEEKGKSKSNPGVSEHFSYENLNLEKALNSAEISSLDIESRICEMKKQNELNFKSKANLIKYASSSSREDMIDKFKYLTEPVYKLNRLENPQDLNENDEPQHTESITCKKESWSCNPSKKVLMSTNDFPSIDNSNNYYLNDQNLKSLPLISSSVKPELFNEKYESTYHLNFQSKDYIPNRRYQVQQEGVDNSKFNNNYHTYNKNKSSELVQNQQSCSNMQSKEYTIVLQNVRTNPFN